MIDLCHLVVLVYVIIGGFNYAKCNEIPLVLYQYSQWTKLLRIPDHMIAIF